MNIKLKRFILNVTPPPVLRLAQKIVWKIFAFRAKEQPAPFYDDLYRGTDGMYVKHYSESQYYPMWLSVAERLQHLREIRVLDLGCGVGQFAEVLKDKGVRDYCGVDFSPVAVDLAKKKCPNYKFICTDILKSDVIETHNYDCLVSLEFLEHIDDDLGVIRRIKAGTTVLASVPNFPCPSHVRHFVSESDVRARYEKFFKDFRVDAFTPRKGAATWYLFEGIKI